MIGTIAGPNASLSATYAVEPSGVKAIPSGCEEKVPPIGIGVGFRTGLAPSRPVICHTAPIVVSLMYARSLLGETAMKVSASGAGGLACGIAIVVVCPLGIATRVTSPAPATNA